MRENDKRETVFENVSSQYRDIKTNKGHIDMTLPQ
jgi:hypothetical protein